MWRTFLFLCLVSSLTLGKLKPNFRAEPPLENGAPVNPKVFYEVNPTALTSNISVVVMTGSMEDPIDKVGLTHLLAEMVLRGTKTKSREKFQGELERIGGTLSASVSSDMILFSGGVVKENHKKFMALLEEALLHPALTQSDFNELKDETLNQIAHVKNSNNSLGGLAARREIFKGTPLERPFYGGQSTVKNITLSDIQRRYNDTFDRPKIVFAAAAPFPETDMVADFAKIWRQFPDGSKLSRRMLSLKIPEKPTLIVVNKPKTSTGALFFAQSGITVQDPDRYTLLTGNFSFGGEPLVSRLFRIVRGEMGWTYSIGSSYSSLGGLSSQQGIYSIASTPSVEFTAKTLFKTLEMWRSYLDEGLTSSELELARDSLINSYPFEFESAAKRVSHKIKSFLYGVPILSPEEYAKTIGAISNAKLKATLKEKHKKEAWLIALVADNEVVAKALEEAQKDIPKEERLTISKVYTPDELVE